MHFCDNLVDIVLILFMINNEFIGCIHMVAFFFKHLFLELLHLLQT